MQYMFMKLAYNLKEDCCHIDETDSTPPLALSSFQFHTKLKTFFFDQVMPIFFSSLYALMSVLLCKCSSSYNHFHCYHSPSHHSSLVSDNKPPSVIATWVAFAGTLNVPTRFHSSIAIVT